MTFADRPRQHPTMAMRCRAVIPRVWRQHDGLFRKTVDGLDAFYVRHTVNQDEGRLVPSGRHRTDNSPEDYRYSSILQLTTPAHAPAAVRGLRPRRQP